MRVLFLPQWYDNPYQRELYDNLQALGVDVPKVRGLTSIARAIISHWDILHLHWLHSFYRPGGTVRAIGKLLVFLMIMDFLRKRGTALVWTVHNLEHHEDMHPRLDHFLTRFVVARATAILVHCHAAKAALLGSFPEAARAAVHVVPHGHFASSYRNDTTKMEARDALGIDQNRLMLLFFGRIRPYKGVLELIEAFRQLPSHDLQLVIAGKPLDEAESQTIRDCSAGDDRVDYRPGFVADDDIQLYLNASDVVVLPYRDVLTSGAAILAMSFGRACVAPRIGCLPELLDKQGAFLYEPEDEKGLLRALRELVHRRDELATMGQHNCVRIEVEDWGSIAKRTLKVYRNIAVRT